MTTPALPQLFRFLFTAVCLPAAFATAQTGEWQAGVAAAKITPEGNMWMAGYAARKAPAEGVDAELYAKALVIEDKTGGMFALITLDLISIPRGVRLFVAEQARQKLGIPPERLAINASHTHCGPELRATRVDQVDDPPKREAEALAYTAKLQDTLVRLLREARAKAAAANLDFCRARCGFAMNRRSPDGKGGWRNFPNPSGPVDHDVPVLKVTTDDGKEVALVFGYACHCTTLGYQRFNADYAGYAQQALQKAHPGAQAMFVNGCSGDQNPYPRGKLELAETHGQSLATAVEAALTTTPRPLRGSVRAAYREVPLAFDSLPSAEQLRERMASKNSAEAGWARRILARMENEGTLPTEYPYPVQVVRLGDDLTWIMLGGEVVVDYSLRLKREISAPVVWVSAYTNDVPGYIPSRRVWAEGGYEGGEAMRYGSHPNRWSGQVEDQVITAVRELVDQLK